MRALVVGARRRRQGIGAYVARSLLQEGVELCAVVGSRDSTARRARDELFRDALSPLEASRCHAYSDLEEALSSESPDIACVCSPFRLHREHLEIIANHSCHCLCEKPFLWSDDGDRVAEAARIVERFVERERFLSLVTQWPCTLPDFFRLYPTLKSAPVLTFQMHMGPTSQGEEMILDAAPHPLSMLQHLVGCGTLSATKAEYLDAERRDLCVYFDYLHAKGVTEVRCRFKTTECAPRPASFSINGSGVVRSVGLPRYDIYFQAGKRKVRIEDPLRTLVREFLREVASGASVKRQELIEGVSALEVLYSTASAAV